MSASSPRGHLLELGALGAGALARRSDGLGHRLQLGVLLAQAHDLGAVGGRAHPRLHLVEAVEHLVEPGLGKAQTKGPNAEEKSRSSENR